MWDYKLMFLLLAIPTRCDKSKGTNSCEKRCPAVDSPVCARLVDKAGNRSVYVTMVNKCEMNYVKCHKGLAGVVVAMKNCDHNVLKVKGKKRSKRDAGDDVSEQTGENASPSYREEVGPPQYIDGYGKDGAPPGLDADQGGYQEEEGNQEEILDQETEMDGEETEMDEGEITKGQEQGNIVKEEENQVEEEGKVDQEESQVEKEESQVEEDEDQVDQEEGQVEEGEDQVDEGEDQVEEGESQDQGDIIEEDGSQAEQGIEDHEENQVSQDPMFIDAVYDDNVDKQQYNSECPVMCPLRDVMVCGRCQHGVYRTFLSVCHLRMFRCQHRDESLSLVSRSPCVLSAPFLSESPAPAGRVREPGDDDVVLRYLRCSQLDAASREADPRCYWLMNKPKDVSTNQKLNGMLGCRAAHCQPNGYLNN